MKKNVIKVVIALTLLFSITYAFDAFLVVTKINEDIPKKIKEESQTIATEFIDIMTKGDIDRIDAYLSPMFKKKMGRSQKLYFSKFHKMFKFNEFSPLYTYYSSNKFAFSEKSTKFLGTLIPDIGSDDKLIINNYTFRGEEALNIFLKSNNKGMQYICYLNLSKYKKHWKIDYIAVGDYAVNNKTVIDLVAKAKQLQQSNKPLSANIYAQTVFRVIRPTRKLQYPQEKRYIKSANEIIKNSFKAMNFPIKLDNNITLIGVKTDVVKEGIVPFMLYVTNTPFEKSKLEKEAHQILPKILELFPDIKENFNCLILQANKEIPLDPKKHYTIFNTVIKLDSK